MARRDAAFVEERPLVADLLCGLLDGELPALQPRFAELRQVGLRHVIAVLELGIEQGGFADDLDVDADGAHPPGAAPHRSGAAPSRRAADPAGAPPAGRRAAARAPRPRTTLNHHPEPAAGADHDQGRRMEHDIGAAFLAAARRAPPPARRTC